MGRKKELMPIIIKTGMKKGIMAFRSKEFKYGIDIWVCWLNREFKPGERFELKDISWIQTWLHFCDRKSVEITITVLKEALKHMKEGEEDA